MHARGIAWLARGLAIAATAVIIALWVLQRPVSAPEPAIRPPTATSLPTQAAVPRPTSTPTQTTVPTPAPTATPTLLLTVTPPPTPSATDTPSPTTTPEPAPTADATIVLTAPAVSPAPVELAGRVEQHFYLSQVTGGKEAFRIYIPPGYDETDRRYPVLYLCHGWPYDDAHWDSVGADEAADIGIVTGALPPFIIVMPRGTETLYTRTSGGAYSFEALVINDLIPHIDATYRTWAQRDGRAIGGISRGAVWALEIALYHADTFAAVGAHSPALSVNLAPPLYDPFYLLDKPGVPALRIYLDAGDADWARGATQSLGEAMARQGIAHDFITHSGRHDNRLWAENVSEYLGFYAAGWPYDGVSP